MLGACVRQHILTDKFHTLIILADSLRSPVKAAWSDSDRWALGGSMPVWCLQGTMQGEYRQPDMR